MSPYTVSSLDLSPESFNGDMSIVNFGADFALVILEATYLTKNLSQFVSILSGGNMEEKLYESRPFVYLVLAFYALVVSRSSLMMVASGLLLLLAGTWVWRSRYNYRLYYRKHLSVRPRRPRVILDQPES
jgi:hypothetical protein